RDDISRRLGINVSSDTYRQLIYKYIYTLKDLRNAIVHNDVVFDTRFRKFDPNNAMKQCLKIEIGLPYVNFKTIGDYVILMCYYLKMLKVSKTELKGFVREFEKITENYRLSVNTQVASKVIHPDLVTRMNSLKNYF
ncbi:MAG: Abi family protein, partial [Clostridiales bacterium]|nr:Abi family protein [Clostridiales bacterium]